MVDSRYMGWSMGKIGKFYDDSGIYHLIVPLEGNMAGACCRRNMVVSGEIVQKLKAEDRMCKKCEKTIKFFLRNPQKTDSTQTYQGT